MGKSLQSSRDQANVELRRAGAQAQVSFQLCHASESVQANFELCRTWAQANANLNYRVGPCAASETRHGTGQKLISVIQPSTASACQVFL